MGRVGEEVMKRGGKKCVWLHVFLHNVILTAWETLVYLHCTYNTAVKKIHILIHQVISQTFVTFIVAEV